MHLFKEVKKADYVSDYKLMLTFEDETKRLVDLQNHLHGEVFEPLKKIEFFKLFKVNHDTDTIEWPNEADFSPDFLFTIGKPV